MPGDQQVISADHPSRRRRALAKPLYWYLSAAFFLVSLASSGLIIHFAPVLTDRGMDPRAAAAITSVVGLFVSLSRLFTGFVIDRLFAPRVATGLMLTAAFGYVLFIAAGPSFAVVRASAICISFGAEMDLIGFIVSRYFGLRSYGRLYGLMYSLCLSGTFLSPLLYGFAKDNLRTYVPMIILAIILLIIAAIILFLLPAFPSRHNKEQLDADLVPNGKVAGLVID